MNQADRIKIEAPEKIQFSYRFADLGARIGAFTVDMVLQAIIVIFVLTMGHRSF